MAEGAQRRAATVRTARKSPTRVIVEDAHRTAAQAAGMLSLQLSQGVFRPGECEAAALSFARASTLLHEAVESVRTDRERRLL